MALVAPMPIPHNSESTFSRFNRRSSDMAIINSPVSNNYRTPQITLESIAAGLSLFGSSPTGEFSYLTGDIYDDHFKPPRGPLQKSRSFPNTRRDDPMKGCVHRAPLRKAKSVRFADSQGLPLVERVHQLKVSDSSYTECKIVPYDDDDIFGKVKLIARPSKTSTPQALKSNGHPKALEKSKSFDCAAMSSKKEETLTSPPQFKRQLSPNFNVHKHEFGFTQPSLEPDFFDRVNRDSVVLESVREEPRSLHGIVRVANIAYEKEISIRWTHDNWRTSHDTQAVFCSHDGETDRFAFELPINGDDVIFAVRYRADKKDYWDNNRGKNYIVYSRD